MLSPDLVSQYSKKNERPVEQLTSGSTYSAIWVCDKGHEWEAKVFVRKHHGCPYCSHRSILPGFNDFTVVYPRIAAEWHPVKNGNINPTLLSSSSVLKVWWKCEFGHEWEAKICSRTSKLTGCRTCSRRTGMPDKNVLTVYPHLTRFVTEKTVQQLVNVPPYSDKTFQWECPKCYHVWVESVKSVSQRSKTCPFCNDVERGVSQKNRYMKRRNVVWDVKLNNQEMVFPVDGENHWWKCVKCSSSWESSFVDVFYKNSKCLTCENVPLAVSNPILVQEWSTRNLVDLNNVSAGSGKKVWWKCSKGHEWEAVVYSRARQVAPSGCPECNVSKGVSKAEKDVFGFVTFLLPEQKVHANYKKLIHGKELDIYVPEKNIAIEFNGLYWHDEHHKPKNYHYDKWLACKEAGVQLIQIWEDDWTCNPDLVKRMLAHKLGVSAEPKIYARNTTTRELTKQETENFLLEHHIQGVPGSYSVSVGLINNVSDLVAVIVLKVEPDTNGKVFNLLRFATSQPVTGGFTKLMKYVKNIYNLESVVTFSDNCVSDGGLYESTGFVAVKKLPPDYMYVVDGERKHKFGYRLKRFRNDPVLEYVEGLTERELALLNNLPRIWDAGKTRWVKTF